MVKQRKRKYQDGKQWPRGRPVWQVALAIEPTGNGPLRLVFHVPHPQIVATVFNLLRGTLFTDYQMTEEVMTQMLNGKCHQAWVVDVIQPDLHRLSLSEWPAMIKSMMERRFRVQVTCFDCYEKFLNA